MIDNIMYLRECFAETDRLDRIYINFCNPWPRGKHKKRRLTHPRQLVQYRMLLDGESGSKLTMTNYLRSRWNIFRKRDSALRQ